MSWSYNGVGRAGKVAEAAAAALKQVKCAEPEESIKNKVSDLIAASLAAFPANTAVKISASGSQSKAQDYEEGQAVNSVYITIEPLWGFVD